MDWNIHCQVLWGLRFIYLFPPISDLRILLPYRQEISFLFWDHISPNPFIGEIKADNNLVKKKKLWNLIIQCLGSKIIPFTKPVSEGSIEKLTSNTTWNKAKTVAHWESLSPRLKPPVFLWTMKLSFVLLALHQMRVQGHARTVCCCWAYFNLLSDRISMDNYIWLRQTGRECHLSTEPGEKSRELPRRCTVSAGAFGHIRIFQNVFISASTMRICVRESF